MNLVLRKSFFLSLIALGGVFGLSSNIKAQKIYPRFYHVPADIEFGFWGLFRPEAFAAKNFTLLNDNNPQDQTWYFRHTLDLNMNARYGIETYGYAVAEFQSSWRQRSIWGDPGSMGRTLEAETKNLEAVNRPHSHGIPRLFPWMREGWLKFSLTDAFCLSFENQHTFTLGAFPFQLGRGISLGAAYALASGQPLGFYSDGAIDQYAFGFKLSGDIIADLLSYDIYGSILSARSVSVSETGKKILGQQYGHLNNQARGYGKDAFLVAARLFGYPIKSDIMKLSVEPYVLYANDPEQRLEFPADTKAKLGTLGVAVELEAGIFEAGFDTSFNMGRQTVKGWDRNQIIQENFDGIDTIRNDEVRVQIDPSEPTFKKYNGLLAPYIPRSQAQKVIDAAPQESSQNGQPIPNGFFANGLGFIPGPLQLVNSNIRFRDPYDNIFKGYMCVGDFGFWLYERELMFAFTAGIASGDQDPNSEIIDGDFAGFIGLQEVYAGKRVKSVFLLGTVGKVRRPSTIPEEDSPFDNAQSVSGFSNLILVGSGLNYKPISTRRWVINPNVVAYWEDSPGEKFDFRTKRDIEDSKARSYLGTEANLFLSCYLFDSLKWFAIGSVFFPGGHFTDIKGKPLDREQLKLLDNLDRTGFLGDSVPNIGDNIGWTVNVGLDYTF